MNALAELPQRGIVQSTGRLSASEVVQHAMVVQDVMRAVMKPELHYGKIPGTDKPTLFQPGADVLCMTFRIAPEFSIEDLSTADVVRYRVTCRGVHQLSGATLGSCVGEASSGEEKYKWRRAVNDKEFEATPPALRRIKYGKSWETKQVRTEPADVANTVLKMAEKRAKIGMVLNVTACSDMFGQDLEDLDAVLRDSLVGEQQPEQAQQQGRPEPQAWPDDKLNEREAKCREWATAGKTADDAIAFFATKGTLTEAQKDRVRGWMKPAAAPAPAPTQAPAPAPAPAAAQDAEDIPWKE